MMGSGVSEGVGSTVSLGVGVISVGIGVTDGIGVEVGVGVGINQVSVVWQREHCVLG